MIAYLITNTQNGKQYVGITTRNIDRRWYEHKYVSNSCGKLLSKAIKKYGEEAFKIEPIASSIDNSLENLKAVEKQLIEQCGTKVPNGYNLTDGGDGVFGFKPTEEQIKRLSEARLGSKHSEETKSKMSETRIGENNAFFGKQHTEESKKKISETKKGCAGPWQGKQRSEETKRKVSEGLKKYFAKKKLKQQGL